MDFELTEEQNQIKALIREFFKREVDEEWVKELGSKCDVARTTEELRALQPVDLWDKWHEVGLRQMCVPTEYGGGGINSLLTVNIATEEVGYQCFMVSRMLSRAWMRRPTATATARIKEQEDWFYSQYMKDHTYFSAGCNTEPTAETDYWVRSPSAFRKTFAYKDGNEWVITGDKSFSAGGGIAKLYSVAARTNKEGTSLESEAVRSFWVKYGTPGMTVTLTRMIDQEIMGNAQVSFDNVRVPEIQLMGDPTLTPSPRGGVGNIQTLVPLLGGTRRMYEQVVEYAKQRIGGGRPIIQHSHIAALLGEAAAEIEATRLLLYRASVDIDERQQAVEPVTEFLAQASLHMIKRTAFKVAEVANDIYGGMASAVDMPLESFIRHMILLSHSDGTMSTNAMRCSMSHNDHKLACHVPELVDV